MSTLFKNPMHEQLGSWPLAYIPYGGADFGELRAVATAIGDGDDTAFYDCWVTAADRLLAEAESSQSLGRLATARGLYQKAACFYSTARRPLFGSPVDARVVHSMRRQQAAFERALALRDVPVLPLEIPFDETMLPACFIGAEGREREVRPLLILTNGYDGTLLDLYFASAVAATRRGYHCLMFDGPGQGGMLIEKHIPLRPDWETVLRSVVDFALTRDNVDPDRMALSGWSLGGYLAPRAASGEHRLAACVADPGQQDVAAMFRPYAVRFGATREQAARLSELPQPIIETIEANIDADPKLRWAIRQRGYWVNGVDTLRDYLRSLEAFNMAGRTELIRCPTLFTLAEDDPLASGTQAFFDALRCPKQLLPMRRSEGAGEHCEMGNRTLLNTRVLDWLDETLQPVCAGSLS